MIGLGLRLSLGGGREAWTRLAAIAGGVMIGVTLLLFMISGLQLLNGTLDKSCWQCTGQSSESAKGDATTDPIHWKWEEIAFNAKNIRVYNVAKTGPNTAQIPGVAAIPGPGEFYASPALAKLLQETPNDQLDDRFPDKLMGEIGRPGLEYPRDLIAIVGRTPAELPLKPDIDKFWADMESRMTPAGSNSFTYPVWKVNDQPKIRTFNPFTSVMFTVIVGGLLSSIVTLIATTTRLSASRREQKFAALRLFGATPKQINQLAAIDAAIGAGIGALLGIGLFYLVRAPLAAGISSLDVVSFFPEDLQPGIFSLFGVLIGAPLLAASAAIISLRKVRISPLGVTRKTTPKPPTILRLLMPVMGILVMVGIWWANRSVKDPAATSELMPYFMVGFVLLVFGIAIAGPWLTMALTRIVAKRTRTASALLAFRRLADNPQAAFQSVSVLVIAVFMSTLVAALSPIYLEPYQNQTRAPEGQGPILLDGFFANAVGTGVASSALQPLITSLAGIPGVHPVIGYSPTAVTTETLESVLVRCQDVPRLGLKPCSPNDTAIKLSLPHWFGLIFNVAPPSQTSQAIEYLVAPSTFLEHSAMKFITVVNGGQANVDRVRTALAKQQMAAIESSLTLPEMRKQEAQAIRNAQYLVYGILLLILFIASCSLAISVAGGLVERKRPFGLLRVTGTSLGQLRKVVAIESLVPFVAAMLISMGLALLTAVLMVETFADEKSRNIEWLPLDFYLIIAGGIGLAALVTLATMPLLASITKPENTRFE